MVLYVKDVGGYFFTPSLTNPLSPSIICGNIQHTNKICGEYPYTLRVYLPWKGHLDLFDTSLTVLYIKALFTYQKYR